MDDYTTLDSIKDKFFSLIVSGEVIPEPLVDEWVDNAIGYYELELGVNLETEIIVIEESGDSVEEEVFKNKLSSAQKSLLGRYMQRDFITRELSRFSKITGIDSKDEKVSGLQATKYTLRSELEIALLEIAELVSKLKDLEHGK